MKSSKIFKIRVFLKTNKGVAGKAESVTYLWKHKT